MPSSKQETSQGITMMACRGGPRSSDHVDLLGNVDVMEDVLRIAAGQLLEDNITSSIADIAAQIKLPESASAAGYSLF